MLNVLGSVAQFEREMMLERQREGIAKAKAEGKYKGRKPLSDEIVRKIREMVADKRRPTDIARQWGVGRDVGLSSAPGLGYAERSVADVATGHDA